MFKENPIFGAISQWFNRNFSDPEALGLFFTLVLILVVVEFFGQLLAPILLSIVLSYLLYAPIQCLRRWHLPNILAVLIVYLIFVGLCLWAFFGLVPVLVRQLISFINEVPTIILKLKTLTAWLIKTYPHFFHGDLIAKSLVGLKSYLLVLALFQYLLTLNKKVVPF